MVLSKSFRVYHKLDNNSVYSLLLEQKNYKSESLLFEADAIAAICNFNVIYLFIINIILFQIYLVYHFIEILIY